MLKKNMPCRAKSDCGAETRTIARKRRFLFPLLAAAALLTLCTACSKRSDDESDQMEGKAEAKEEKPFAQRIAEDREKGFEFSEDGTTLLKAPYDITEYDIPEGVTAIEKIAFSGCCIRRVTIPDSVTSIEAMAFEECTSLKRITIPSSVKSIGEDAFKGAGCEEQVKRDYPHLYK